MKIPQEIPTLAKKQKTLGKYFGDDKKCLHARSMSRICLLDMTDNHILLYESIPLMILYERLQLGYKVRK